MSPEVTVVCLIDLTILAGIGLWYFLNWLHAVKVREFQRGAEHIRRAAYPHLVNTSLTGYKNAKEILKPRR